TITGSTSTENNDFAQITADGSATVTFNIANNADISDTNFGITVFHATTSTATSALTGTIDNNTVTIPVGGLGSGIRLAHNGAGTMTVAVADNTVHYNNGFDSGIFVRTNDGSSGSCQATVTGNTVNIDGFNPLYAMEFIAGSLISDTQTLCLDLADNTVNNTTFSDDVRLRQRDNSTFQLHGFAGNGFSTADVASWVTTNNPGLTTVSVSMQTNGFSSATCTSPAP
ncbi:MAG: hypothetical protein JRI67_10580, partial [Deltaproteobacteria bacterium]|nr:hypothetical protein [Deltaproteobacteria bacterium]